MNDDFMIALIQINPDYAEVTVGGTISFANSLAGVVIWTG